MIRQAKITDFFNSPNGVRPRAAAAANSSPKESTPSPPPKKRDLSPVHLVLMSDDDSNDADCEDADVAPTPRIDPLAGATIDLDTSDDDEDDDHIQKAENVEARCKDDTVKEGKANGDDKVVIVNNVQDDDDYDSDEVQKPRAKKARPASKTPARVVADGIIGMKVRSPTNGAN